MPTKPCLLDFHGCVDENTYALNTRGSLEDLSQLAVGPTIGLRLTFWADDGDDNGNSDDLLIDGTLDRLDPWGWVARVDPSTWRHASDEGKV